MGRNLVGLGIIWLGHCYLGCYRLMLTGSNMCNIITIFRAFKVTHFAYKFINVFGIFCGAACYRWCIYNHVCYIICYIATAYIVTCLIDGFRHFFVTHGIECPKECPILRLYFNPPKWTRPVTLEIISHMFLMLKIRFVSIMVTTPFLGVFSKLPRAKGKMDISGPSKNVQK